MSSGLAAIGQSVDELANGLGQMRRDITNVKTTEQALFYKISYQSLHRGRPERHPPGPHRGGPIHRPRRVDGQFLSHSVAIKRQPSRRLACCRGHYQVTGNRCPPKRSAKASASSSLEKQNTTKSGKEYERGVADGRRQRKYHLTVHGSRTFSAGSATSCGQFRLRSAGDFALAAGHRRISISLLAGALNSGGRIRIGRPGGSTAMIIS
jgi:hypothetical protein